MRVFVYNEGTCQALNIDQLTSELEHLAGVEAEIRTEFVDYWIRQVNAVPEAQLSRTGRDLHARHPEALACALVKARIINPLVRWQPSREVLPAELAAEKKALQPGHTSVGILYDGGQIQALMAELLPTSELQACHIILTERLLGTFAAEDGRWHARTSIYGEPNLISTSGLLQAPVRPKEYYQLQGLAAVRAVPREIVEAQLQVKLRDRMLVPNDDRLTAIVVGLTLQAIAFYLSGQAFCENPTCRLFNAHRQEELLRAHYSKEAHLCATHQALFASTRGVPLKGEPSA
ncbi:MAG: DUF6775 family putative metallopeptidase [Candidatus Zipacnadales bacterium]